jgi:cation diffusion facilitator CzcD-associated flavoprotein CzcO
VVGSTLIHNFREHHRRPQGMLEHDWVDVNGEAATAAAVIFILATLFEKADQIGGTWRENTYPGACCDVPSMFYCFSFEQRTDWPRKWSPQNEILDYMQHCVAKYDIAPHVRLGCAIEAARYDEATGSWSLRTAAGDAFEAEVLVSGVGQLHKVAIPDIPGLGDFEGPTFHSAQWDHGVDLADKRVAVVGNAASAIQFIPEVAKTAAHMTIFQRSANWMIERNDHAYSKQQQERFARHPWWAKLYRSWLWARAELLLFPVVRGNRLLSSALSAQATQYMHRHIKDPKLRETLTPDYPICGKRVLVSDDYYPALARDNVDVTTSHIERIEANAVVAKDGTRHEVDAIVLATGFDTTHFLSPMKFEGVGGRAIEEVWRDGAKGYLGMTVPDFPNFFMMYGPNTNLGHNSIIFMIECQSRYIIECIRKLRTGGFKTIELRGDVMDAHDRKTQADLEDTAWAKTEASWYKNAAGRITNNWPHSTAWYWWVTRKVDWSAYTLSRGDDTTRG